MTNRDLKNIIELIQKGEGIDLSTIAAKAGIDRSYLSKFINSKKEKPATDSYTGKIAKHYPSYFIKQHKTTGKIEPKNDLVLSSLKEIRELAIAILTGQSAGQEVIMGALDRLEENPEGSLSSAADKLALQLAQRMNMIQRGNDGDIHKKDK